MISFFQFSTKKMKALKLAIFLSRWTSIIVASALIFSAKGYACTLWAAAGDKVGGGETLIAKNRDWKPDHRQILSLKKTAKEGLFNYYGLFKSGDSRNVKAGINERGLVVVSASPPFSSKQLREMPRTVHLNHKILTHCQSVSEALKRRSWLLGPRFLLLADRHQIASIEIATEGKSNVRVSENGVLYHTNHYLEPQFRHFNAYKKNLSSFERFKKISGLMSQRPDYGMKDFIAISSSADKGPDHSIWRTGKTNTSTRTLATWIVRLPVSDTPQLFVRIANPGEDIMEYHLNAASLFNP